MAELSVEQVNFLNEHYQWMPWVFADGTISHQFIAEYPMSDTEAKMLIGQWAQVHQPTLLLEGPHASDPIMEAALQVEMKQFDENKDKDSK